MGQNYNLHLGIDPMIYMQLCYTDLYNTEMAVKKVLTWKPSSTNVGAQVLLIHSEPAPVLRPGRVDKADSIRVVFASQLSLSYV